MFGYMKQYHICTCTYFNAQQNIYDEYHYWWYFLVSIATGEAGGQWRVCEEEEEEGAVQRQSIREAEANPCAHQCPAKVGGHVIVM